jgi:squalene-hopene/tetraprenyl-beta-curcumene cyclase
MTIPEARLAPAPAPDRIEAALESARAWLAARQHPDGWWCGELEADTTLESYIVLLDAFLGRDDAGKHARLAAVIRGEALPAGGWSAYPGGPADLSVSCLAYFALKLAGEAPDTPLMRGARAAILALGGAGRANSYTRYHLALFGQVPWHSVPAVPPEMVLLPPWAPFSVHDLSAWSRTIFVPLSVVYACRPVRALPRERGVGELFAGGDDDAAPAERGLSWRRFFTVVDRALKRAELLPGARRLRRRALRRAAAWIEARMIGADGLGAILPAMTSTVLALRCLGRDDHDPVFAEALAQVDRLLLPEGEGGGMRVQPCFSPVWDTCFAANALLEAGAAPDQTPLSRAAGWLIDRQCRRPGDWAARNPAPPGGWAFEFRNEPYPDVDDTAMALMVLGRARVPGHEAARRAAVERGLRWLLGMQNRDGGWASFDRGNDKAWLTQVPFADHNAMIDPSTADITGRVLECLGQRGGFGVHHPAVRPALTFLRGQQELDGSWYGRWGVNYLYGTAQVLRGLSLVGEDLDAPYVRRAARWLAAHQNADGGWGESIASYDDRREKGRGPSTASQTAWALIGLIAAGHAGEPAVRRGVRYLLERQSPDGTWPEEAWTGTGFPRVFYLRYHLYPHYFPMLALARYRAASAGAAA